MAEALRAAHPAGGHQAATFSGTASNGTIRAPLSSLYVPTIGQRIDALVPDRARAQHSQHVAGYTGSPRLRPMGIGMERAPAAARNGGV